MTNCTLRNHLLKLTKCMRITDEAKTNFEQNDVLMQLEKGQNIKQEFPMTKIILCRVDSTQMNITNFNNETFSFS